MPHQTLVGRLVTSAGIRPVRVEFAERILAVEASSGGSEGPYLVPGFLDLHVHGGGGAEVMQGEAGIRQTARFHAQNGTTAFLATTVTAPWDQLLKVLADAQKVMASPAPGEAQVLGVHLEGPFINPAKLGAQPDYPILPQAELAQAIIQSAVVKVVTLAPELPGAQKFIAALSQAGIRVQIGHTGASYAESLIGLEAGALGFTHLFNAMPSLHHRSPGAAGAALERGHWAEIIPDGLHVHPAMIRLAQAKIPGLYVVTDAVAASGMPDGPYPLGSHTVLKQGEGVYLDSTLAGSVLTMAQALRNLVEFGFTLPEAVAMLAERPARYLNLSDRGLIWPGAWADLLVLDRELRIEASYVRGQRL